MAVEEVLRAYKFTLDPTDAQRADLARYAGASRWAYNYALAWAQTAHRAWADRRDAYHQQGLGAQETKRRLKDDAAHLTGRIRSWDNHRKAVIALQRRADSLPEPRTSAENDLDRRLAAARAAARDNDELTHLLAQARASLTSLKREAFTTGYRTPSAIDMAALWRTQRDLPMDKGGSPWWQEVNTYCFASGFARAERAWKNWMDSCTGARAGRRVGYPRFKAKGRARDSFTLYHNVATPGIRLDGYRRLTLPKLGTVRLQDSGKRLARLIDRDQAVVQSVTVTRGAHRWYASVLVKVQQVIPDRPTARQRAGGLVAVDLGSRQLAALSCRLDQSDPDSTTVDHPRHLQRSLPLLAKAQRAFARTEKGSKRRSKAADRIARIHHRVALRRATTLHGLTKRLATGFSQVAIEDLSLADMTASARGTIAEPGANVKVKARFNRHLLDAGLGELRRQLVYKTGWYGSTLIVLDKAEPVASTCTKCGERDPSSKPADTRFTCRLCGHVAARHENSVANILNAGRRQIAMVASGTGETLNARGASVRPSVRKDARQGVLKREGTKPPGLVPPRRSDPPAFPIPRLE